MSPIEGLTEVSFGSDSGVGRTVQCDKLALDPKQLGQVPTFVASFAASERLFDGCEPQPDLTCRAEASRQFPKHQQEARKKPRLPGLLEGAAECPQPGADIAAPGDHRGVEAARPDVPQTNRVPFGMVEQHRTIARSGVEIARQKGDRACPLAQDAAKGQGLPNGIPFLDIVLDHAQRPLGKSLQPQNASLEVVRRYPHIETHADDLVLLRQRLKLDQRAIDMLARYALVTQVMQDRSEETIGHHQIDRISGICHQVSETPGKPKRGKKLAVIQLIDAQAPKARCR